MSVLDTIRADQLAARKAKDEVAKNLLTTLIGEAVAEGKKSQRDPTDAEVVATVQKFIKNLNDVLKVVAEASDVFNVATQEKAILAKYLPTQLSEQDLHDRVSTFIAANALPKDAKSKGPIMKHLKDNYAGQYDGAVAAKVVTEALT